MSVDRPEFRLSDAEREDALEVLGEHLRTGRLDIDDYAERSARIATAKTHGDLIPLFADLPEPRPGVFAAGRRTSELDEPAGRQPAVWWTSSAVPVAAVIALVLFFTVARGFWPVFLLPAVVAVLVGAANGGGGQRQPGRGR